MKITLSFVGYIQLEGVQNNSIVDIENPTSIDDLLETYGVKKEHKRFIVPVVNGSKRNHSYVLEPDDSLFLYVPLGGG